MPVALMFHRKPQQGTRLFLFSSDPVKKSWRIVMHVSCDTDLLLHFISLLSPSPEYARDSPNPHDNRQPPMKPEPGEMCTAQKGSTASNIGDRKWRFFLPFSVPHPTAFPRPIFSLKSGSARHRGTRIGSTCVVHGNGLRDRPNS